MESGSARLMARVAAELDAQVSSVELGWAEFDRRRAAIERLRAGVVGLVGAGARTAELADHFLDSAADPFSDPATLLAQARLGREIEARLREELRVTSRGELPSRSPGADVPRGAGTRGRRARPPPEPFLAWLTSPAGLTFVAVAIFVVLGAYERLTRLGALSLWNDEAQSTLLSFSILQHGYPVITSQHLINNYEPLYPYLEAASVRVLGQTNFAFRLPSALIGIALVPLSYYIGSRLRDRYVGMTLAAMVAFSSEYVAWSRQARWYMLLVFLMACGLLLIIAWARTPERSRRRWYVLGMLAVTVLAGLTSIGLFLLYIPALFVAVVVYAMVAKWNAIRRMFGYPAPGGVVRQPARFLPYPERRLLAIIVPALLGVLAIVYGVALVNLGQQLAARAVGFQPYPLVWSSNFGTYLGQYYLGVLILDAIGAAFIVLRRKPLEVALLAFTVAAFLSVSTLASLTNDIAGGNTSFERHIVPLLFFLFVIAAIGLVEGIQLLRAQLSRTWSERPHLGRTRPIAFGIAVALLLIVPGVVIPSHETVHQHSYQFPTGGLVTWRPFAVGQGEPSAVYQSDQANYQLAAEYVAAHRNSTDVVASTNPGAPQVYLGAVQYWVRGNAENSTIIYANGSPEFFQTGSLLVNTTPALLSIMFNGSGWLISDVPSGTGVAFPGGLDLVLGETMRRVGAASDSSITLYSWNTTTRGEVGRDVARDIPALSKDLGNFTAIADWESTVGVTTSHERLILLPIEGYLLRHVSNGTLPQATLLNVYNNRPDLQTKFPWVLNATTPQGTSNQTALNLWASEVCQGLIHDGSRSILLPYANWYAAHG